MKTTRIIQKVSLFSISLAAVFVSACSSLRTVNIQEDSALAGASVEVDVVPLTDQNKGLETCSVRQYWQSGSALRRTSGATTLRFGPGNQTAQTVSKDWQGLGAKKVVILADLPGVFQDAPGDSDPRRKLLPVAGAATVSVSITPSGLVVQSK